MGSFTEALTGRKAKSVTATLPKLGITTQFYGLDSDALYEVGQMGGLRGVKYGLYLACPQLQEEGAALFAQNKLPAPEEIASALSLGDMAALWQAVLDISAGEATATITGDGFSYVPTPVEEGTAWGGAALLPMPAVPEIPSGGTAMEEAALPPVSMAGATQSEELPGTQSSHNGQRTILQGTVQSPQEATSYDELVRFLAEGLVETAKNM